jgi:hypothetical protein
MVTNRTGVVSVSMEIFDYGCLLMTALSQTRHNIYIYIYIHVEDEEDGGGGEDGKDEEGGENEDGEDANGRGAGVTGRLQGVVHSALREEHGNSLAWE